jgi:hypothetical protein
LDVAIKYLLETARQIARSGVLDTLIRVERSTVGLAKRGWKMLPTDCRPRLSARRVLVEFNLAASCGFLSCVIDELFLGLQVLGGTARERDGHKRLQVGFHLVRVSGLGSFPATHSVRRGL